VLFALCIRYLSWEIARAMEVYVSIDLITIQLGKISGIVLGYLRVAIEFTDDGTIFTFN
jgi:hypothetical protein